MERAFDHSFANVRVHDGGEGDRVAREHGALALTVGEDLFFRRDAFEPDTPFGARVLAHELAHVVQQSGSLPVGDEGAESTTESREHEAHAAADAVTRGESVHVASGSVAPGTPQRWPWYDDPGGGSGEASSGGGFLSGLGSLASGAWDATKSAARTVYEGYQTSTDFKPVAAGEGSKIDWSGNKPISLPAALGAGVDWYQQSTEEGNKKAVESVKGIPVLEQLAQASGFISNTAAGITGGVARGVGDIGFGVANAFFHPLDALSGAAGILEHNSPVPFLGTALKGVHGAYDIATGNEKGEYGSTWGELGNHLFNPLQQQKDDAKYNSGLMRGILAPGTKDWDEAWGKLQENPADMLSRAATNVLPIALGIGEAAAGEAGVAGRGVPKGGIPEPPPTLRTPYAPPGVPEPPPFNPEIPIVEPGPVPSRPPSLPPSSDVPSVPSPFTKPSPGVLPAPFELPSFPPESPLPWDNFPGFGEWEPITKPFPPVGPELPPSPRPVIPEPAPPSIDPRGPPTLDAPPSPPRPISQLDPALGPRPIELDPLTQRSPQLPPGFKEPPPFNPEIPGPTSGDPFPREPISVDPNGPVTARPTSSRSDVPHLDRGDPFSIPERFRGQKMPFPAPREPIPLPPSQQVSPRPQLPLGGPLESPLSGSGGSGSFPRVPSFPDFDFWDLF